MTCCTTSTWTNHTYLFGLIFKASHWSIKKGTRIKSGWVDAESPSWCRERGLLCKLQDAVIRKAILCCKQDGYPSSQQLNRVILAHDYK